MGSGAYRFLEKYDIRHLRELYEEAGKRASKDEEVCPSTFSKGIRIPSLADELVSDIVSMARERSPHVEIAAHALIFMV